jgi:serine protease
MSGEWSMQWPLHEMGALAAWDRFPGCFLDAGTRPTDAPIVAVIDSGVDEGHPDFINVGATSAEVGEGGQLMLSAARTFLSAEIPDPQPGAHDEHGHGTHLAALIAAAANNGATAGEGIAGIAYPARLLPLKVTAANGVATYADISRAIVYAADQGASVILLGFASENWSQALQAAIDYAWDRGCLVVAPVGNTSDDRPMFPASCPHVFAVAASNAQQQVTAYSTRGSASLAAPGGDDVIGVYSALPTYYCTLRTDLTTPAYGWLTGTPQAAAHVAGAAALYSGETGLRPQTGDEAGVVSRALQRSATLPQGQSYHGWNPSSGYGLLALDRLLAAGQSPADTAGGIVGRVLIDGAPAIGAVVTATNDATGAQVAAATAWPAGGYHIANIPSGCYHVTAHFGGKAGVWEQAVVMPGCDLPGIDFALGSPAAAAVLVKSGIPEAAVCGKLLMLSASFKNTGVSPWTRGGGYRMILTPGDRPLSLEPDHANLPDPTAVKSGEAATFAANPTAPEEWGFYQTSWQMCQQGGVGRFGPVVRVTVSVTSFLDVRADHWAAAWVEAAKSAGIVCGYDGDVYNPDWPVTREQLAVFIARALAGGDEKVPAGPSQPYFSDVPVDSWAFHYVQFARERGVISGYPNGSYLPRDMVDRSQMAAVIARAMTAPDSADLAGYQPPATPTFSDVPAGVWAYKYVEYIRSHGVASGYPDRLYHPDDTVKRDQMAVFVAKALKLPT